MVALQPWPTVDESVLDDDNITMPIQVNGKRRGQIEVRKDLEISEIEELALEEEAVQRALNGEVPKKIIIVPGRIVNVVI